MSRCIFFNGGVMCIGSSEEFTDHEVEDARRTIARFLRVRLCQVTDEDGIMYLREQAPLAKEEKP